MERETCLYNDDDFACNYGVGIGVIAFLASIAFLAGEYLFEQMSSVKSRKHYVMGDLGFSGEQFLYFQSGGNIFRVGMEVVYPSELNSRDTERPLTLCVIEQGFYPHGDDLFG